MRPRDLGIPFDGVPGPLNAITDVPGMEVGMTTLIQGESVRTGVTAILPRGRRLETPCFAAIDALNGNGEMTGSHWVHESGFLDGPILITNTHSVGVVRDAVIAWQATPGRGPALNRFGDDYFSLPVVAETADVRLNDMYGFAIRPEHVFAALDGAAEGAVPEGNVGGGTGMICHGWKGGTGTASREVGAYHLGVLVQANHGAARRLMIAGVPIGEHLRPDAPLSMIPEGSGSIIVVVATDAPLLPHQLRRLARRVPLGIGRVGGLGENSSGDLFIALSTAAMPSLATDAAVPIEMLPPHVLDPFFAATVAATEEAIVNALFAARPMVGFRGHVSPSLPFDEVLRLLHRFGRI